LTLGTGSTYKPEIDCNVALCGRRGSFLSSFSGLKTTRLKSRGESVSMPGTNLLRVKQASLFDLAVLFEN
jgi:hypothetical protein